MASIIKKMNKGKPYYYAVECKRVNGKPRIVWQKYLGTIDSIIARKENESSCPVKQVDIFEAGGVAAMLRIAEKLKLVEIIDEIVPKRRQGVSVGQYLLLAAINRIFAPCSKLQIDEWYNTCVLRRLWKHPQEYFSSQNFWNHMDLVREEHIDLIQEHIANRLKTEFKIDPTMLLYDTTNFFTYVATGNHRNTIAKRGRNKSKRDDLRQVGLALLVSKDFQIPLFHKTYQGNIPDRGLFIDAASEVTKFHRKTFDNTYKATLIFDKGNISEDAMEKLIVAQQPFVCAIPKTTISEFFSTSIDEFNGVPEIPGTMAYTQHVEIWNKELKAVLTYSESFFMAELVELTESLRKCEEQLQDLQKHLSKGPQRPNDVKHYSESAAKRNVDHILSQPYLRDIVNVQLSVNKNLATLTYSINREVFENIQRTKLGRTILVSTQLEWNEKEIISAYRSQQNIEAAFKLMKNKDYLHWQPSFHWTDMKLKVHGLYCVLALLLATLSHKTTIENGMNLTLLQMLDELSGIREVALINTSEEKTDHHKNKLVLSRMSPMQRKLSNILEIETILTR